MAVNMLEQVEKCYICGSTQSTLLMPVKDGWYGLSGEFNLMKCSDWNILMILQAHCKKYGVLLKQAVNWP